MHVLLAYLAELELEVDRLRKQGRFVQNQVREALRRIHGLCAENPAAGDARATPVKIDAVALQLAEELRDLQEPAGYHPAHDQVVAIAIRPLTEQVFRWQQRWLGGAQVELRFELGSEHVEWFPARLRHILDNLISNSLRYRDTIKTQSWVQLALQVSPEGYEFRVTDNGVGMPAEEHGQLLELFHRAAPARAAGLGVGLAVVKLLVEQSGGTLKVDSGEGQGATFVVFLPRYDLQDFLTN